MTTTTTYTYNKTNKFEVDQYGNLLTVVGEVMQGEKKVGIVVEEKRTYKSKVNMFFIMPEDSAFFKMHNQILWSRGWVRTQKEVLTEFEKYYGKE